MPAKRKIADLYSASAPADSQSTVKIKSEDPHTGSADYSLDVKKKLSATSRTGAACDRCRIRKMRCDDQPEGCASCRAAQTECKTTDRITGKAAVRGYVENLERRVQKLERHIEELQSLVVSLGGDVTPSGGFAVPIPPTPPNQDEDAGRSDRQVQEGTSGSGDDADHASVSNTERVVGDASTSIGGGQDPIRLPEFRCGLIGNNYLGVSTGNSLLSSVRGTSMNVLGMVIDLADYMSADLDEPDPYHPGTQPLYNKSYHAFVQTAFGEAPRLSEPELPPRDEGMTLANYYFKVTNPYLPIVHKPSFMTLLTHMYDDRDFRPSYAESVMVHTAFAIILYQIAVRASQDATDRARLSQSSNHHYHYALGLFPQLMASHTLADVQALAMLCLYVRNLPKPGGCWMLASITLNLAIELGLHRSAKNWAPTATKSVLEIELRKRTFWSILGIQAVVAGNLGRPMPLSSGDWDVEMPEMVDDDYLTEDGMDTSKGQCNFLVGIQVFKIVPLYMDLFKSIYAVRRSPQKYEDTVRGLERRLQKFSEQIHPHLLNESAQDNELGRVHVQYCLSWPLHIRLLLRHPALSLTTSSDFNAENLDVCLEVSKQMLGHVKHLQVYKSLEGTWQTGALYVLAIATTLFVHSERRDQITPADLIALRNDMDAWLTIMADYGALLGSGNRLRDTVAIIVDKTLNLISQHLASKTASSQVQDPQNAFRGQNLPHLQSAIPTNFMHSNPYPLYTTHNNNQHAEHNQNMANQITAQQYVGPPSGPGANTYNNPQQQYTYPPAHSSANSDNNNHSTATAIPPYPPLAYGQSPSIPTTTHPLSNNYVHDFPSQPYGQNPAYSEPEYHAAGSPSSWRNFAGTMSFNHDPGSGPGVPEGMSAGPDFLSSGPMSSGPEMATAMSMPLQQGELRMGNPRQMWPMLIFDGAPRLG